MSTNIAYLQGLRADLMEAATRANAVAPGHRSPGRPPRRPVARWKLVAASAAAFVVAAGVVGFLADHRGAGRTLAVAGASPAPARTDSGSFEGVFDNQPDGLRNALGHDVPSRGGAPVPGAAGGPIPAPSTAPSALPGQPPVGGEPAVGPNIIKTGELDIRVARATFVEQFQKATSIAERYDGYVQTSSTAGTTTRSGSMTIRVPADKFGLALADLRVLGRVLHQEITGQDVTAQFVDLAARLKNAELQQARLRKLLSTAATVGATLDVNRVLSQTELLIEELRGQMRVLQNRTDLGTIHLNMEEQPPKVAAIVKKPSEPPVRNPHLGRAFAKSVAGFLGVVFSVVVGIGYLLPLLVVALVTWFVVRRVRRSRAATA